MPEPSHRDGPLAFVASLDAPVLSDDDHHHFSRVLRVRDGAEMVLCDGAGSWRRARFGPTLEVTGPIERVERVVPELRVGFALLKGDRPELVVQKLTELGIDRIVPFTSDHCVVRWNADRAAKQVERLRRIAREASMQCRRTHLPVVEDLATFAGLAVGPGDRDRVALAERAGGTVRDLLDGAASVTVLIGPEGGWSDAELGAGTDTVGVAVHTLRAETAAIAAGALLTATRAGL
ncbi:MAG: RsmE family RNA methyltransferase [Acidimicrobiales bacterium]